MVSLSWPKLWMCHTLYFFLFQIFFHFIFFINSFFLPLSFTCHYCPLFSLLRQFLVFFSVAHENYWSFRSLSLFLLIPPSLSLFCFPFFHSFFPAFVWSFKSLSLSTVFVLWMSVCQTKIWTSKERVEGKKYIPELKSDIRH